MRGRIWIAGVFLVCCTTVAPGWAQDLAGTWTEKNYGLTLSLSGEGTYRLVTNAGEGSGQYGVQGRTLVLQDPGGTLIYYSIQSLTGEELVLADATGITMHFRKEEVSTDFPWKAAKFERVLVESGAWKLKESHIQAGVYLLEFMIGSKVTEGEIKKLRADTISEFKKDPGNLIGSIEENISKPLESVYSISDAVKIGSLRQELFYLLYDAYKNVPAKEYPVFIKILYAHIKVLIHDEENRMILSNHDVESLVEYLKFINQISSQPLQISPQELRDFQEQLVVAYPSLSLDQKKFLCSASLLWEVVEGNWKQFSAEKRQRFKAGYQNVPSAPSIQQSPGALGDAYCAACFELMEDMTLQNHVSALNMIENMGGTPEYWEIREGDYY